VRLRAPTSFLFERAFEPSTIKGSASSILPPCECAFEPSLHFFSSAPSSPWPSKVVHLLSYLLFERAFEPSTIKGSASSILPPFEWAFEPSPYFFSSAPSSPRPSKVVHLLSYLLFECAFEPSTIKGSASSILPPFEGAFEPSPHFFSSASSSPRPSKVVHFLSYLLLSAPSILRPSKVTHYNVTNWAGNPLQCDHLGR